MNLQAEYSKIDKRYFDGQLTPAKVEFRILVERYGEANHGESGHFEIQLDPKINPDVKTLRETIKHESCHVFVYSSNPEAGERGVEFQDCMSRFTSKRGIRS